MPKNIKYPNHLRHYRLKQKLTQQAVEKDLGHSSVSRLSAWEQGSASPSIDNPFILAKLYNTTIEKLYGPVKRRVGNTVNKRNRKNKVDSGPTHQKSTPLSSDEMTIEQQLDVLAQLIVEAYIHQKKPGELPENRKS